MLCVIAYECVKSDAAMAIDMLRRILRGSAGAASVAVAGKIRGYMCIEHTDIRAVSHIVNRNQAHAAITSVRVHITSKFIL